MAMGSRFPTRLDAMNYQHEIDMAPLRYRNERAKLASEYGRQNTPDFKIEKLPNGDWYEIRGGSAKLMKANNGNGSGSSPWANNNNNSGGGFNFNRQAARPMGTGGANTSFNLPNLGF